MANVRAFRSGLWSDTNPATSPWGTGGVLYPPATAAPFDDVFTNSFTIQIDTNPTVVSLTNASATSRLWKDGATTTATQGGTYNLTNNTTLSGNVITGSAGTPCLTLSGANSAIVRGGVTGGVGGSVTAGSHGISHTSTGSLRVEGTVTGGQTAGSAGSHGINFNSNGGTLTVVGDIYPGSNNNTYASGIVFAGTGNATITGNLYGSGSTGVNTTVVICGGAVNLTVTGNVYGGAGAGSPGISITSTGVVNIISSEILGGAGQVAISNTAAGSINVVSALIRAGGFVGISSSNANSILKVSGNIINAPNGTAAIYAASYFISPVPTNGYIRYARNGTGIGSDAYLFQYTTDSLSAFSMPPISAVRQGTTFANGTLTGTCAMPEPQSVAYGVVYDNNSVGTAALSPQNIFSAEIPSLTATNSIGVRLKNAATTENVGKLIASFNP